jgi:hypothetical protein
VAQCVACATLTLTVWQYIMNLVSSEQAMARACKAVQTARHWRCTQHCHGLASTLASSRHGEDVSHGGALAQMRSGGRWAWWGRVSIVGMGGPWWGRVGEGGGGWGRVGEGGGGLKSV